MAQNPEPQSQSPGRLVWSTNKPVLLDKMKIDIPMGQTHVPARGERIYLMFRDMSTVNAPGTTYQVYLKSSTGKEALAGSINFFSLEKYADSVVSSKLGSLRQLDVTEIASKLTGKLTVSIRASVQPVANAQAKVGRLDFLVVTE